MQHEKQFRIALTRVLAQEHAVDVATIQLIIDAKNQQVSAQIGDQTHDYPYLVALEKAFALTYREAHPRVHGYYPVAHLHREDLMSHHGHYVASQLSEDDIESLAEDMWNDAFADMYWESLDWIVEERYPELIAAPMTKMEQRLKIAIVRFRVYDFGDLDDATLLGFLKGLVQAETAGQVLTRVDLAERFLTFLKTEDAIPSYLDEATLVQTLNLLRYEATIQHLLTQAVQDEHPMATALHGHVPTLSGLGSTIQTHFEAGTPPEAIVDDLLTQVVEQVESQRLQQRAFEEKLRINRSINVQHELRDPESGNWLRVQIQATASGLSLTFPQLRKGTDAGEGDDIILGVDYYNNRVQALINDAAHPVEPQVIHLETTDADAIGD